MVAGCAYGTRIQREAFNISPVYCHEDECFYIQRKTAILLFNIIPDGQYKYMVEETTIEDGNEEFEKHIQTINVNGNIVTAEIDDLIFQYSQKKRKLINIIDKSGTLNKKEMEKIKNITNQTSGFFLPTYASSGDIISFTMPMKFGKFSIKMNWDYFVHGITTYEGNEYALLEIRGKGTLRINRNKVSVTCRGYALRNSSMIDAARSVMDITLKHNKECFSLKTIMTQKEI